MKLLAMCGAATLCQLCLLTTIRAQTPAPPAAKSPEMAQLEALVKKIDEQNTKIDALSQQILKLQQEIAEKRPGIIIGESPPATTPVPPADSTAQSPAGKRLFARSGQQHNDPRQRQHIGPWRGK